MQEKLECFSIKRERNKQTPLWFILALIAGRKASSPRPALRALDETEVCEVNLQSKHNLCVCFRVVFPGVSVGQRAPAPQTRGMPNLSGERRWGMQIMP